MQAKSKPGPKARHDSRLMLVCPSWLKRKLAEDSDREERPISEIVRERISAPYRDPK